MTPKNITLRMKSKDYNVALSETIPSLYFEYGKATNGTNSSCALCGSKLPLV